VVLCHQTMVAGWVIRTELVLNAIGTMQVRVNGESRQPPLRARTLTEGRRQYHALLKQMSRPVQMRLPI
jgi:hypothetical protein